MTPTVGGTQHALLCMSHSPLLHFVDPPAETKDAVERAFDTARRFVADFRPDVVVNFGPDHYNGFFYDLMPPFCIGYAAHALGDYDSFSGSLTVPGALAEALAAHVMDFGVDVAISRRMEVDHGAVQPLEIVCDDPANVDIVPVFVNSVARPFVSMKRVRMLGQAIGDYFARSQARVLFLGSGGLSHDPPVPQYATANAVQRAALIDGRNPTLETRTARQNRVIDTARSFAAGTANIQDLNPEWDRAFLADCASGEVERFDRYRADHMDAAAGHSAHEVRTWVAAYSALRACGPYRVTYEFYRPIREYIAGFAVTTAVPDPA